MSQTAVLLTCFNRKEHTINCLKQLFLLHQDIDVYLVDDNSTDGTYKAIENRFPEVTLIRGTGNLYWNRGMHLAWETASKKDYEFYIWLNDDVVIKPYCFKELFECAKLTNNKSIITGIIVESKTNKVIYGGRDENGHLISPNGQLNTVKNMNGNVVLIPKSVFKILGNLDFHFIHDFGDVDYGLRALKENIKVVTTRVVVATGESNPVCRVRLNNSNFLNRFKKLYSPLGSNPFTQLYFLRKHKGPIYALFYFIFLHFINLIPDYMNNLIFRDRYISSKN